MMFHFSMTSLLMSVLFSNLLLILLYGVFRNTRLMMDIGHQLLTLFLAVTLVRFLLPFELPCSTNIYFPEKLSWIIILIQTPLFPVGARSFSLWQLFLAVWLIGAIAGVFRLFRTYRRLSRTIRMLGTELTDEEPFRALLQQICEQEACKNRFRVTAVPNISSPMIAGLIHPVILIPDTLPMDYEKWYYILKHETAHYFQHDLWLKLFSQLLCILYWWNPLLHALKQQISTMLELRTDRLLTASAAPVEKLRYMECLAHIAKQEGADANAPTISFSTSSSSLLLQRFQMIGDSAGHKRNRKKQVLLFGIIVGVYLFSILFIFEPHYVAPEVESMSFEPTRNNAYFIVNPNGGYDLYLNHQFITTVDHIDEYLLDLDIHYSKEEIP